MSTPNPLKAVVPPNVMDALLIVGSMLESVAHLTEILIMDGAEPRENALYEAIQACFEKADRELESALSHLESAPRVEGPDERPPRQQGGAA